MEGVFMKWEGGLRGLPGWAVMLAVLVGGVMLAYALVCLSLAVYLWFDPIVWRVFIVFGSLERVMNLGENRMEMRIP
jgi:hypothetical protein